MNHYYTKKNDDLKSNEKTIKVVIKDFNFSFITDHGVFSKAGLDFGSRLLIESVLGLKHEKILDMGSGYGPIGIIYKKFNPSSQVTMVDVNDRALALAKRNAKLNNQEVEVKYSDVFSDVNDKYDLIITNPPIRAGKDIVYSIFEGAFEHLNDSGVLIFVINKKHGAPSAIKKCEEIFDKVSVITKKSGYYVIKCNK
ncbi:MAG: class I SAM-dependent methyltransferase [Candidatus Izemoplasmatales bacterium]|nr:class I SAM-dependent methyltransferase [Candidatus Izemoplasmatales bacterium]